MSGTARAVPGVDRHMEDLDTRLTLLHDQYVWSANAAVARGVGERDLDELCDPYTDDALRLLVDAEPARS